MAAISDVKNFWESHVNNEYYTAQKRGSEEYFRQITTRRYRYHYHLPELFDRMAAAGGRELLEVGCGIGIDSVELARRGFRVAACDLTESALAIGRGRCRAERVPIRFVRSNAEGLPFSDAAFDHVYSFGVIHHTPDIAAAAREIHRVLRPGGRAWVMIYHRSSLVNAIHTILRLPFESPRTLKDHCPVVVRSTRRAARELFRAFGRVDVSPAYPFTYGMRALARFVPRPVERVLGRLVGWHLMIEATK